MGTNFVYKRTERGFTLIEISIAMLIFGVIAAVVFQGLRLQIVKQKQETTKTSIAQIQRALADHLVREGDLPCPASLTAGPATAAFGTETDCEIYITGTVDAVPADGDAFAENFTEDQGTVGLLADGTYRVLGREYAPGQRRGIRIGAVPFRQLNIPAQAAQDGYGNRFYYVVTERAAAATKAAVLDSNFDGPGDVVFDAAKEGAVEIVDAAASVLDPPESAVFYLFSPGTDNKGGFTPDGVQITACTGVGSDIENCDFLEGVNNNIFTLQDISLGDNAGYFDDSGTYAFASAGETMSDAMMFCMSQGKLYMPGAAAAVVDANGCVDAPDAQNNICAANEVLVLSAAAPRQFICQDISLPPAQVQTLEACGANQVLKYVAGDFQCVPAAPTPGACNGANQKLLFNGNNFVCAADQTGTTIATKTCLAGEVVTGVHANGTVTCSSASTAGDLCGFYMSVMGGGAYMIPCKGVNVANGCPAGYTHFKKQLISGGGMGGGLPMGSNGDASFIAFCYD